MEIYGLKKKSGIQNLWRSLPSTSSSIQEVVGLIRRRRLMRRGKRLRELWANSANSGPVSERSARTIRPIYLFHDQQFKQTDGQKVLSMGREWASKVRCCRLHCCHREMLGNDFQDKDKFLSYSTPLRADPGEWLSHLLKMIIHAMLFICFPRPHFLASSLWFIPIMNPLNDVPFTILLGSKFNSFSLYGPSYNTSCCGRFLSARGSWRSWELASTLDTCPVLLISLVSAALTMSWFSSVSTSGSTSCESVTRTSMEPDSRIRSPRA